MFPLNKVIQTGNKMVVELTFFFNGSETVLFTFKSVFFTGRFSLFVFLCCFVTTAAL